MPMSRQGGTEELTDITNRQDPFEAGATTGGSAFQAAQERTAPVVGRKLLAQPPIICLLLSEDEMAAGGCSLGASWQSRMQA